MYNFRDLEMHADVGSTLLFDAMRIYLEFFVNCNATTCPLISHMFKTQSAIIQLVLGCNLLWYCLLSQVFTCRLWLIQFVVSCVSAPVDCYKFCCTLCNDNKGICQYLSVSVGAGCQMWKHAFMKLLLFYTRKQSLLSQDDKIIIMWSQGKSLLSGDNKIIKIVIVR